MPPLGNVASTLGMPSAPATTLATAGNAGAAGGGATPYPAITIAQQLAAAAQLPAVQKINDAQAASDASAREQQQTILGYMHALAPIVAGIAPSVQQGYTQAAGLDALLGKGFGNELQGQQQANQGQANGILQTAGATPGQAGAVGNAIGGPGTANALGWLNGGLPATGLNQAGAAFGAAAKALPAELAGQGLQQVQSLQARQGLTDQGFAQKQTDLAQQYPGLVLKTENQVVNQQATQAYHAATVQIAAQRADIAAQAASDNAAYQKGELSARDYANKISAYRAKTASLDAQVRQATAQYNAATGRMNANTSRMNAATSYLRATTVKSQSPASVATASRDLTKQVAKWGNPTQPRTQYEPTAPAAQQVKDANGNPTGFVIVPGTGGGALSYQDALHMSITSGPDTAAWRRKATAIVNASPYYQPGGPTGRPYAGKAAVAEITHTAKSLLKSGVSVEDIVARIEKTGLVPLKLIAPTVNRIATSRASSYYRKTTPAHPAGTEAKIAAGQKLAAGVLTGAQ